EGLRKGRRIFPPSVVLRSGEQAIPPEPFSDAKASGFNLPIIPDAQGYVGASVGCFPRFTTTKYYPLYSSNPGAAFGVSFRVGWLGFVVRIGLANDEGL